MITTGGWGVQELMKYLVAVKESLTPLERDRLRQTAAFPQEGPVPGSAKPIRRKPGDLYEPISSLRELGLPILDWGDQHKWRPNSEEGASSPLYAPILRPTECTPSSSQNAV